MEENKKQNHAQIQLFPQEEKEAKESTPPITKFALGDEMHKFNDDDEVLLIKHSYLPFCYFVDYRIYW